MTAGVAPARLGSTLVTSTFTWSLASSRRIIKVLSIASLGSLDWPKDSTAAARTMGSGSCNHAWNAGAEAGVEPPIAPKARMAWLRTPPSSSRAAFSSAGRAPAAVSPILPSATAAVRRTSGLMCLRDRTRAGIAPSADTPIWPRASAARAQTPLS